MIKRLLLYLFRRIFIFADLSRPVIPWTINLLWYNKKVGGEYNVGDFLSVVVTDYLLKRYKIRIFPRQTVRLSVIGSVIQFVSAPSVVFGSGFLNKKSIKIFNDKKPKLQLLAVRGPLSLEALFDMGYSTRGVVLGDPAVLMPLIYAPPCVVKKYDYIVIPHYSKLNNYRGSNVVSTLTNDWKSFINSIVASKLVISSSLHGIILAESYGVPCVMLNDTETSDLFKYEDYYRSTGRKIIMARDVDEALNIQNVEIPNLEKMQERLLMKFASFK